jgi:hypothetical protein
MLKSFVECPEYQDMYYFERAMFLIALAYCYEVSPMARIICGLTELALKFVDVSNEGLAKAETIAGSFAEIMFETKKYGWSEQEIVDEINKCNDNHYSTTRPLKIWREVYE